MKRNLILLGLCIIIALGAIIYGRQSKNTLSSVVTPETGSAPVKTLIPTRAISAAPALTPEPVLFIVKTRAGQEVEMPVLMLEPNEYVAFHTEAVPQGIPLSNGIEVSFDALVRVDFGYPSPNWDTDPAKANWPVSIILTDGSRIDSSLGFKAHHQLHVTGQSNLGFVDIQLPDIESIAIKRSGVIKPIPAAPAGTDLIKVTTLSGESILVADAKVFARCMYEVYCCHDETLASLPLKQGDIALNQLQSAIFSQAAEVSITQPNGSTTQNNLRPSATCADTTWRLRGKAALGDFEIELSSLQQIQR